MSNGTNSVDADNEDCDCNKFHVPGPNCAVQLGDTILIAKAALTIAASEMRIMMHSSPLGPQEVADNDFKRQNDRYRETFYLIHKFHKTSHLIQFS